MRFELLVLDELGFGLDLTRCAATGQRDELVYVSPKTGRAVSREAGAQWHDKMLALPAFPAARRDDEAPTAPRIEEAFRLTGFFLTRHVYEPRAIASRRHAPASSRLAQGIGRSDSKRWRNRRMSEVELSARPCLVDGPGESRIAHEDGVRAAHWPGAYWWIALVALAPRLELGPVSRHNHSKGQG